MYTGYRHTKNNAYRLERQLSESILEENEYCVKKLRFGSYGDVLSILRSYDSPYRKYERNWKSQRKTQYK